MSVANLYKTYLGRDPDAEGLKFWQGTGLQGQELKTSFLEAARTNNENVLDPNRPSVSATSLSFLDKPRPRGLGSSFAQSVSSSGPSALDGYTGPRAPVQVQMAGQGANTDVMEIATGYMDQDSPIMQQAATAGRQAANRRGLLNSSLAAGAVQAATVERILPMAQQTAQQRFQGEMSRQEYQQTQNLSAQEFDQNARLSQQQFRQELASQSERIHAEFDIARLDARTRIAAIEIEGALRERITSMQIKADDRSNMISMMTQYGAQYQDQFRSILSNPDIAGKDRKDLLRAAGDNYLKNVDVLNGLFGYEIDWRNGTVQRVSDSGELTDLPNIGDGPRGLGESTGGNGGRGGGTSSDDSASSGGTREEFDPFTAETRIVDENGNPVDQGPQFEPRNRPTFNMNSDTGRERAEAWDNAEMRRFQQWQYDQATKSDKDEEERPRLRA